MMTFLRRLVGRTPPAEHEPLFIRPKTPADERAVLRHLHRIQRMVRSLPGETPARDSGLRESIHRHRALLSAAGIYVDADERSTQAIIDSITRNR